MSIVEIKSEAELEDLILKNPEAVEKGLRVLGHQVNLPGGQRIDILAVDGDGALVVMELKKDVASADTFTQALRYYDWVYENRGFLTHFYKDKIDINAQKPPRIILIARSFNEDVKLIAKYFSEKGRIELRSYVYLQGESERILYLHPEEIPVMKEPPPSPPTIEDHINYIEDPNVRNTCKIVINRVKSVGDGVEVKPTSSYLAFQYRGRNFMIIETKRKHFYVRSPDWSESETIYNPEDFTDEWFKKVKEWFKKVGGKLKSPMPV